MHSPWLRKPVLSRLSRLSAVFNIYYTRLQKAYSARYAVCLVWGWDQPRSMARPKLETGTETVRVQIVAPATFVERVDEWRAKVRPIPSRAEAIRILVDQALDAGGTRQKQSQA